jgi:hypothetical protein
LFSSVQENGNKKWKQKGEGTKSEGVVFLFFIEASLVDVRLLTKPSSHLMLSASI